MASEPATAQKRVYSVWALLPDDVVPRLKKLMDDLRSEFGGPQFEPHVTVVGAMRLTEEDAINKLKEACSGLKPDTAKIDSFAAETFLLLHHTDEVVKASQHCDAYFCYQRDSPYMPHLSLIYGDLSDDERKKVVEKANSLDESISTLTFQIERLALYETDTEDETLESWRKVAECSLTSN